MTVESGDAPGRRAAQDTRIRVLQVIRSLHFGGEEKVVAQLATGLDPREFEVRVACTHESGRIGEEIAGHGIPVIAATARTGRSNYFAPFDLWRTIRQFRPQVIHSHGVASLLAAGPLAYAGAMPDWVHTFHFANYPYKNRRHMHLEKLFARRVPKLIAVASSQREAIVRHHGIAAERIAVVPNGIPPNEFLDDAASRRGCRAEFGFADDDFVVGTVCVMSEQKGISYLLEAAAMAIQSQPRMKFLLVGGGRLEAAMRARAEQLGLDKNVVFTGWRSDVHQLLTAFDVFVMSSLWEAMPLALLEAMAARRAMVVTDVGDNAVLVNHGECALIVEPKNAAELAAAFERLATDRAVIGALAGHAVKRYQSHYTVGHMIRAYERLYRAG